ncbi:GPN-loop GTPase [Phytophthora megakarya]|uniref:GPN-loop GTPase 3 n=1 Tax=Phytophthora megakarya TaxID=4795 RepID=A0A225X4E1_9STRA|nr:GPN-loop GTPase [Phytophthora megakarya]
MLETRNSSNELDLAYMPYHEGLVNHNAPPVRGSLSVRVSNQHPQSPYYGDSDEDDVSDDPAWMAAPRGSLQPAFPSSLMKKASSVSVTDTQTSSPKSPGTDVVSSAGEEDEQEKQRKDKEDDDEDDDDYFPPTMPKMKTPQKNASGRRSLHNVDEKLTTDLKLRKCKSMPMHQAANPTDANRMVNLGVPRNSRGNSEIDRLSVEKKSSEDEDSTTSPSTSNNGYRDSMMRYRPSDLKPQDLTTAMMSRDSLAPENFESSRSIDMYASSRSSNMGFDSNRGNDQYGSSRSSNVFDSNRGVDPFASTRSTDLMSGRGSVMHFGPRVTEEGLSDYLRAVKTGNLQVLRSCLQDRNTDFTERDPVHGQSAMHIAVRFGQLHAVQLLCGKKTRGLLIDAVDNRQNTPLHLAAAKSRRITKYLLEHGADASRANNRNQTPLAVHIITAKRDDPLIAEMLLQHKTDPNGALGNSTLLHKAVDLKFFEIAYRLVRHGARLDAKDAQGRMVFEKVDRKVLRQLCGKISFPPVWVPNLERKGCMICLRNFSRLGVGVRRHHCRHCGRLICGRCSHVSVESEAFPSTFIGHIDRNPSDERSNLKRVCKTCSSVFDERAKQAKTGSPGSNRKWSDAFMDRVVGCAWDEIERKDSSSNLGTHCTCCHAGWSSFPKCRRNWSSVIMRCCQMVMGPAGTGKSTYCNNMHEFCAASGRMTYVVNLDPAADHFDYPVAFDIRDLISVEDVMEELGYGPNGGLIYCMEYLVQNLDWLQDLLGEYSDEDYFIFDCPGQIELYSHLPVMKQLCDSLKDWGFNICCVYLIDSLFIVDPTKFISGVLCSLSAMVQLELPHINVLTKCDLVDEKELSKYLDPSEGYLLENLANATDPKWRPLSAAICNVINDFSMVAFVPMNINREESIETVLMHVDHAINYGDDLEPQV